MSTASKDRLFASFPSLDGFRLVLLCWVMLRHSPPEFVPAAFHGIQRLWGVGVDGFLAVSGFLVTRSLQQCHLRAGGSRLMAAKDFLIRRISRVAPPYYLVLVFIALVGLTTAGSLHQGMVSMGLGFLGFPLFIADYVIAYQTDVVPIFLRPYWSISYQEQFFLLLALAYFLAGYTRKLGHALLLGGLFSIVARLVEVSFLWPVQGKFWDLRCDLHLSLDVPGWGCLAWLAYDELGWLWASRWRGMVTNVLVVVGLVLVVAARSLWPSDFAFAVLQTFKAPLYALFIRMLCEFDRRGGVPFLKSAFAVAVGRVAYEGYLIHVLVYAILEKFRFIGHSWFLLVAYPATWGASLGLNRFLGKPSQKWLRVRLERLVGLAAVG